MKNIAIFASGNGTNAENIISYFKNSDVINVQLVVTNNPNAEVINKAKKHGVNYNINLFSSTNDTFQLTTQLKDHKIDFIVLAGFLKLIPTEIINIYENRIINIHPALLPKYGGKGMFGDKVHTAVLNNNETISGITIHYVNEEYDKGNIIAQYKCTIEKNENLLSLSKKIHELEYKYLPLVVEKLVKKI